ncbi:MAG: M48 family metallopeptidase [Candidatus Omnitrophica bacterium]|nr:M48 family metallopeptidase [Candidatus Omnitrophota bacterium]
MSSMRKRNFDWDNRRCQTPLWCLTPLLLVCAAGAGCATPQYAVRPTPVPEESAAVLQIERAISALQAKDFARQGARPLGWDESLWGFEVQRIVERLSRVTERPSLRYRAYLYEDDDPNAAALADGRVYVSTGMLNYLASRGSRVDELAFVLAHELAHTAAQHLVKRYRRIQQQNLLLGLVAAGASAATGDAGGTAQQAGRLAVDAASLLNDVALSGYSQEQELEADQLGIRYVIQAGFDPKAALALLTDFSRFENPWPFLRTHPYVIQRRDNVQRYLIDTGVLAAPGSTSATPADRITQLREAQRLYPVGSVSWKNLQRQIEEWEGRR